MMRFFLALIMLFTANAYSFDIRSVKVNCVSGSECNDLKETFSSLKRKYTSKSHFYSVFKVYIANEGVRELSFTVDKKHLHIETKQKKKIRSFEDVKVIGSYDLNIPPILPIREGEYIDSQKLKITSKLLVEVAKEAGFPNAKTSYQLKTSGNSADLKYTLNLGDPILIRDITTNANSDLIQRYIKKKLYQNIDKPFNAQALKEEMESLKEMFVEFGYYLVDFDVRYRFLGNNSVSLYLDVKSEGNYAFYFMDNKFFSQAYLKNELSRYFVSSKREVANENIIKFIKGLYREKGFLNVGVIATSALRKDLNSENIRVYSIQIDEGVRATISGLRFKGNSFFSQEDLYEFYKEISSEQALYDYFDERNYEKYINLLRDKYISNGFVSIFIESPVIQFDVKTNSPNILFKIREGVKTKIDKIQIEGVSAEVRLDILKRISNKMNQPFNPIFFKADLELIQDYLQQGGYYFSKITNLRGADLVSYKLENSRVDLLIKVELGENLFVDDIIILGNTRTRKILIEREIEFESGDLITTNILEQSKSNLLRLGLFSTVQIKPVTQGQSSTDILIFVNEKDFGSVELAPGIRSDIGFKLSTTVTYNNIDGMNKRITFNGTVSKRFDLSSLDETRRNESSSLWEFDSTVNYSEDHIFQSDVNFDMAVGKLRKRFFSFDADIQRIGYGVGYDFTKRLSLSIRQQVETISQFDATFDKDDGHFQIGSFTPSISLDLRNRSVNPSKGTLHELSCEFANPFFLSQENDELTIDYYKLISRNKFYVPISPDITLAMSGTFGIQENNATDVNADGSTEGYIPNIKVFRLVGTDQVRGFDDGEINVLQNGKDISEVEVNSRAYMVNLKFEPRYNLSDSSILGVFYDAGRLFVDGVDMDELRSSVGLSFKYITPVGTLDFDYGIKLLRKEDSSGRLESPGRLHVSIGFF